MARGGERRLRLAGPDGEVPDGEVPDGEVPDGEVPDFSPMSRRQKSLAVDSRWQG